MLRKSKEDLDILARRSTDRVGNIETRISSGIKVTGDIEGKENVKLDGSFEGKVHTGGLFLVSPTGKFKGELSAENIIVEGEFEGSVNSAKKIELRDSAKFKGNITAGQIAIAEGSYFEGEIKMGDTGGGQKVSFEEKRKIKTDNDKGK